MKMKPIQKEDVKETVSDLLTWFHQNRRALPWRMNQDPYRIWISEVMLQQTTVQAVIPYYERFMNRFPNVNILAKAKLEDVYEVWTGLGYYSRARNLHKAAIEFAKTGFPKSFSELIEYPGLGPYTARAVSSIAFDEPVGVIDGNVIRVLSRLYVLKKSWWLPKIRDEYQTIADQMAKEGKPSDINQALMELGATVCTPQNPTCFMCPWNRQCKAREENLIHKLPLKKVRKEFEVWIWKPIIFIKNKKVALIQNDYAPFLKKQMIFPGDIQKSKTKPKKFIAKHTITHHQIFIQPSKMKKSPLPAKQKLKWVPLSQLQKVNPSILLRKAIDG